MQARQPVHAPLSTRRVLIGVICGLAIAIPVGFLLGWYRGVRAFVDPVINFFRALPPIALIPLVIVYFGIGEPAAYTAAHAAMRGAGIDPYDTLKTDAEGSGERELAAA